MELDYGDNAYDDPAKFGLELVGVAQDDDACYSFDIFAVWCDQHGNLYYASDSGCSCPSPFEDYRQVSDLTRATVAEIHAALDEWDSSSGEYGKTHESAVELHGKLAG